MTSPDLLSRARYRLIIQAIVKTSKRTATKIPSGLDKNEI